MRTHTVWFFPALLLLTFAVFFSGCTAATEAENAQLQASYDELVLLNAELEQENEALLNENANLQNMQTSTIATASLNENSPELSYIDLYARGNFTAYVWDFLPEFVDINPGYTAVVLSEFQSRPFIAYINTELMGELEINETYLFEVPEAYIGNLPEPKVNALLETGTVSATELCGDTDVYIDAIREPAEDETGLSSPHLEYYT